MWPILDTSATQVVDGFKSSFTDFCETNPTTSVFLIMVGLYYLYYLKNVVRKPELICSDTNFKQFLEETCPIISQEFKPTIWCPNTHGQTFIANGIRAVIPIPSYKREFIRVADEVEPKMSRDTKDDITSKNKNKNEISKNTSEQKTKNVTVTIDWYEGPGPTLQFPGSQKFYNELVERNDESNYVHCEDVNIDDGKPIAIFLPGLVGDSQTEYIRTAVTMTNSIGYKTCVFNNRGRGGMKLKTARLYNATNYDDFEACLRHIKKTHPSSRIVAVGISLGGIVLCRYLAELGNRALVDAAMLVSVCFDFRAGCESLELPGFNNHLNAHLTKSLIRIVEENREVLEKSSFNFDFDKIYQSKNLREFDESFTCRMWGYESPLDYHDDATNRDRIHMIKKPTLCINAADDIFCPYPSLPLKQIANNPKCAMLITARGGHIGFMEGLLPYVPTFYLERVIIQYLGALKGVENMNELFE